MDEHALAFARVGAVDHHSVKIAARVPPSSSLLIPHAVNTTAEGEEFLPVDEYSGVKVVYRPTKPLGKWISGTDLIVDESKDWTGVVRIDGLWASTEYEFRLLRPSLTAASHPAFPNSYYFTTSPDPALASAATPGAGTHFTFASSSCVKAGFPYSGPWSKKVTKGAEYLKTVGEELSLKFVLFVGDFIYADVPYYPDAKLSSYHKRYRQIFASPEVHALAEKFPILTIGDDHEIFNDFDASEVDPAFVAANEAYGNYLGAANPDVAEPGANYYHFRHGDAAFFVWDTRAYRSRDDAEDDEEKTMLGERQKEVFFKWAAEVNNTVTWKFVVSSVPLMTLWSHGSDTWAGFTTERDAILDVLEYVPNVIVLSGDRHEFAAASIRTTVTEFSTSPLSMFYLPIRTVSQNHGRGATGEDVLLKYLPDGNSKFSTFEVDTRTANEPVVRVKVWIDGVEAWQVEVRGKPLDIPAPPSAIGSLGKSLLELLGFKVGFSLSFTKRRSVASRGVEENADSRPLLPSALTETELVLRIPVQRLPSNAQDEQEDERGRRRCSARVGGVEEEGTRQRREGRTSAEGETERSAGCWTIIRRAGSAGGGKKSITDFES
ncbi:PhoD-like phosphatase-domain-containing protein [Leucosporidium creatinivorum]|uniref:PhoD-like phosphatase-domain-containing protein n=1 Tax=Leucosporidium creatinivorum TaxID=106004 RepID=A0A1Y2F6J3_9BASI|nr:PhoD-like phosphatase-domain-containing protein [Leucosporidium creatinivorum]